MGGFLFFTIFLCLCCIFRNDCWLFDLSSHSGVLQPHKYTHHHSSSQIEFDFPALEMPIWDSTYHEGYKLYCWYLQFSALQWWTLHKKEWWWFDDFRGWGIWYLARLYQSLLRCSLVPLDSSAWCFSGSRSESHRVENSSPWWFTLFFRSCWILRWLLECLGGLCLFGRCWVVGFRGRRFCFWRLIGGGIPNLICS